MEKDKIAIISDIHGNQPALEAVLKDIDSKHIEEIYCAGDIVGYGAKPNECIEIVKSRRIRCVLGNHDHDVISNNYDFLDTYNLHAGMSLLWTIKELKDRNKDFLKELMYVIDTQFFHLVHGDLRYPKKFFEGYVHNRHHAGCIFPLMQKQLCFIGHTHIAKVYEEGEETREKFPFDDNDGKFVFSSKAIVNVGSVGQPRSKRNAVVKDARASYIIFTPPNSVEFVKVEYDIKLAQKQIIDAGLPELLALRLEEGI